MEETYIKILKGEINIKYLSPIDLVNLEKYLESSSIKLNDILNILKKTNSDISRIKTKLDEQMLLCELKD